MKWKESIEHCFFTDHLDRHLKAFLTRQKELSSEEEYGEFLYKSAYEWEERCSAKFDDMMMPSFFRHWNIDAVWIEFSLSETGAYTLEETLYWTFLTAWALSEVTEGQHEHKQSPSFAVSGYDVILSCDEFQFSKECCVWLEKQAFLDEIDLIYRQSSALLQQPVGNPAWHREAEAGCDRFWAYYKFCRDQLKNPLIARLNRFGPDDVAWYLIQDKDALYYMMLSDLM